MSFSLAAISIALIVCGGLVSGLLFAFSNFVMRALTLEPSDAAMRTMQRINLEIINPLFLVVFIGSALLSVLLVYLVVSSQLCSGQWWLLFGGVLYLLGPIGITIGFNVPLNNRLATTPASEADVAWPQYVVRWLRWNHRRTWLGAVSLCALSVGLYQLEC